MLNSILNIFNKTRSVVYVVYCFWTAFGFSPVIFTTLFVDQELIYRSKAMLKNEYIRQEYLNFTEMSAYLYVFLVFICAIIMTRLTLWEFPKWFVNSSYRKEVENQFIKEEMRLHEKDKLEKIRNEIVDKKVDTIKKEKSIVEKEQEIEDLESKKWDKEFEELKRTRLYDDFDQITVAIARYDSYVRHGGFRIDEDLLTYAYGNKLLDFLSNRSQFELTEKGKYFVMRYQMINNQSSSGFQA